MYYHLSDIQSFLVYYNLVDLHWNTKKNVLINESEVQALCTEGTTTFPAPSTVEDGFN